MEFRVWDCLTAPSALQSARVSAHAARRGFGVQHTTRRGFEVEHTTYLKRVWG